MGMFQERYGKKIGVSKLLALSALATLAIAGISQTTHAALVASDNAGNLPYTLNASFSGQNGGNGFGAWSVTNNSGGDFINSVNWGGITPWFDIYNTGGNQTTATRPLNGVLSSGETLSFDLVLNSAQSGSSVGFFLGDSNNNGLFTFYQSGGGTLGNVVDSTGATSGVVAYNYQTVDQMAFTLTSATTYDFYVNNTLAHSGTISDATGGVAQLNFFDNNGGSNSDVQFTNLSINSTPLPATFALVLAGGIALATMRLNRRRSNIKA